MLIVSTGAANPTVTKANITSNKALLILDLSMPENVAKEVDSLENVTLVNVDELSKITDETLAIRQQEIPAAEAIIDVYKTEFQEWLNHRKFTPAINALKQSLETIQKDEIESALTEILEGNYKISERSLLSIETSSKHDDFE